MDGFYGCYRGLSPKLIGSVVGVVASKKVADKFGFSENDENELKDDSEITEEERYRLRKIKSIECLFVCFNINLFFVL